ncbi:hypothetical protein HNQ07_001217 [Deinococcus metalli]|uniref:DUF2946 domain-containing protein n=1 Tax=Deinococcus metalli TaxID=1141878 RepID=A0A7W8KCN6_9DEIO|nr:hypothetical protein [Deinococcus metalli]MBB5375760.1 hypothetical protein [Deinococcus metalli]GHF37262.1 hypothetical protein GCM10017781_12420 [Deinococcus metalli]
MKARRTATPPPYRWVLALLTVLASFAFLARQPEPGTPTGTGLTRMAAMPDMPADHAERAATPCPHSGSSTTAETTSPTTREDARGHAVPLTTAAPNAPPTAHDHSAHCPFCFTAAFALLAVGVALPAAATARTVRGDPAYTHPALLVLGLAQARAPPLD